MGLLDDIKRSAGNVASNVTSSVTGGFNDLININSLGMPNVNLSKMFRTMSSLPSTFSSVGTNDPNHDTPIKGINNIWGRNNNVLADIYSNSNTAEGGPVSDFQGGLVDNDGLFTVIPTDSADRLNFQTPDWSYADFINERAIFQKSLQNPLGEKGWFYFKIFFNFDTQYGLLGGLLNNPDPLMATNSAYKYLHACESLGKYYKTNDRQVALLKFAKILSYISTYAPWFFKSIKNVNQANVPVINDFTKERSIEIECTEDAVDMRLNTLLDLYKFACFDEIDQKEIVPDNLRKFDMTVMIFQAPIRYFHTSFVTNEGHKYNYKGTTVNSHKGFADTMSFKMYTFINCEINIESLGNMVPGQMSNEAPFTMGGGSIKINYDRVYTHTMNEFMHIMFGNDGLYYDGSGSSKNLHTGDTRYRYESQSEYQRNRLRDIKKLHETNPQTDPNSPTKYKSIVDASEALCSHNMIALGFNALGNFNSGGSDDPQILHDGKDVAYTDYYRLKNQLMKNRVNMQEVLTIIENAPTKLITELVETYNKTQQTIKATWSPSDKILYTDNTGSILLGDTSNSNSHINKANNYWRMKFAQMKDGVSSPETMIENLGYDQRYVYHNFTPSGYADKLVGTPYWDKKIAQMKDGTSSPETMIENSGVDRSGYKNYYRNDNFSESGYSNKLVGSEYWKQKLRQMKDGRAEPETTVEVIERNRGVDERLRSLYTDDGYRNKLVGSRYWKEKMKEMNDGHSNPGSAIYNKM